MVLSILVTLLAALYPRKSSIAPKRVIQKDLSAKSIHVQHRPDRVVQGVKVKPIQFHFDQIHASSPEVEFDPAWENDLYNFLVDTDPENAEKIFNEYLAEKYKHAADVERNLSLSLKGLSELNGESRDEDYLGETERKPGDLTMLEMNHQRRVREILGEHLEPLLTQYELHRQRNTDEI